MDKEFCVKGIVASGMVLQRNKTNCVHGLAPFQTEVKLTFREKSFVANADINGKWKIEFNPGEEGGPFEMQLTNEDAILQFSDVYVGEVWVNSGQSNAQLPMERQKFSYPQEFELPANPYIRMITIPITWNLHEEQETVQNPTWLGASPETIGQMSGTAYFFAKKLSSELNVPVGIINASQGGSPITAWMNKSSLQELGKSSYIRELEYYENEKNVTSKQNELAENSKKWFGELESKSKIPDFTKTEGWSEVEIPGYIDLKSAGTCWIKKTITLTKEQVEHCESHKTWVWFGTISDADVIYVNGIQIGTTAYTYPPRRYEVPKGTLKVGENIISVRLMVMSKRSKIRLYEEKPYFFFTDDVYIQPSVCRNVEQKEKKSSKDGVCISLSGKWQMKTDVLIEDCKPGMFFEWIPTALYNAMLAPCFTHAIAGVLWYQGESNAGNYAEYKNLLLSMMNLWREKFVYGAKNLPFVVMQLPNWSDGHGENHTDNFLQWAPMRQVQSDAVESDINSALAVTIDAGEWNDLHPEKKQTAGTRAANEALKIAYGRADISSSPKAKFIEFKDNKCIVHFDCGVSSLVAFNVNDDKKSADLNTPSKSNEVFGFTVAFKKNIFAKKRDNQIAEVQAFLKDDNTVEVVLPKSNKKIKEIRYLWSDCPAPINLYNKELLPVAPFRHVLK